MTEDKNLRMKVTEITFKTEEMDGSHNEINYIVPEEVALFIFNRIIGWEREWKMNYEDFTSFEAQRTLYEDKKKKDKSKVKK